MATGLIQNFRRILFGLFLGGLILASQRGILAQAGGSYKVVDVPAVLLDDSAESNKTKTNLERHVTSVLKGDVSLSDSENKARFDGWFTRYYWGILTRPDHLTEWVERRNDFFNRRLPVAKNSQVHDYVIEQITLPVMSSIVRDNYHPAARYNAMLIAGLLNKQEAITVGEGKAPPVPHASALTLMLDELDNPNQIDAVRAAALVGIFRHVRLDRQLPPPSRTLNPGARGTRIINSMVKLLEAKEPPEGRSKSGHTWLQRRAADILGMLGTTGDGKVVAVLENIVESEDTPIELRCSAAEALGQLDYGSDANLNALDLAMKLGKVAVSACYQEIDRVEKQQAKEATEKGPAGAAPGGYGGPTGYGMFGPTAAIGTPGGGFLGYRINLTRRQVKDQLEQVRRGFSGHKKQQTKGLLGLTQPGAGQEDVQKYVTKIDEIIKVTDDSTFDDLTALITEIRGKVRSMEDECKIVVDLTEEEGVGSPDGLANPMESGLPSIPMDLPGEATPAGTPKPEAKTPPAATKTPPAEPVVPTGPELPEIGT